MPFTFAHPAVTLPLYKKYKEHLNLSALIIGSIMPDFEYFMYFKTKSVYGHTPLGQLTFNLPILIVISLLFHYVVKKPLILAFPCFISNRLSTIYNTNFHIFNIKSFIIFIFSGLVGMFSHLFLDSFSHRGAFFVKHFDFLNTKLGPYPMYKYIQHGFTLLGFIIIFYYIFKYLKPVKIVSEYTINRSHFFLSVFIISLSISIIRFFIFNDIANAQLLSSLIITPISSTVLGILFTCTYFTIKKRNP